MKTEELLLLQKLIEKNKKEVPNPQSVQFEDLPKILNNHYADSAHFVYELIQNADDVEASSIEFILHKSYLIFIHNGKKKFTITDPDLGTNHPGGIGDINALLWVAKTTKEGKENQAGKFGMGFGAVYKYVDDAYIKEKPFFIKLYKAISIDNASELPPGISIDNDIENIDDKTVFIFPFKKELEDTAYSDIETKLSSLNNPNLFLNNVTKIDIRLAEKKTEFRYEISTIKRKEEVFKGRPFLLELLKYYKIDKTEYLWKVSTAFSGNLSKSSTVFKTNETGSRIYPTEPILYSYFCLDKAINTKFSLNAPFKLTSARNTLSLSNKDDEIENQNILNNLSTFSAESICLLAKNNAFREEVIDVYPDSCFYFQKKIDGLVHPDFRQSFKQIFSEETVIPTTDNKYAKANDVYYIKEKALKDLFPTEILHKLNYAKQLAFPYATEEQSKKLNAIINDFGVEILSFQKITEQITPDFLNHIEKEWLEKFYNYLIENCNLTTLKNKKIFRTNDGQWTSYKDDNDQYNFYRYEENVSYPTLDKSFYSPKLFEYLEKKLSLIVPNKLIEFAKTVDKKNPDQILYEGYNLFREYKDYKKDCEELIAILKKYTFLKEKNTNYYVKDSLFICFTKNQEIRINILKEFKKGICDIHIIDAEYCKSVLKQSFENNVFKEFLNDLGVISANMTVRTGIIDVFNSSVKPYFLMSEFTKRYTSIHFDYYRSRYASCELYGSVGVDCALYYVLYGLANNNIEITKVYSKLIIDSLVDILEENEQADLNTIFYSKSNYGKEGFDEQRGIKTETAMLYIPFLLSKEDMNYMYCPIQEPKLSELADFYDFSNIEKSIRKKILKFLKIEDDTLEQLVPKELEALLTPENKPLFANIILKIKEKTCSENLSLSELLGRFEFALVPKEETEETYLHSNNTSITEQDEKNTNLQIDRGAYEENTPIAISSDNKQTLSSEERIEINKDATNVAKSWLQKKGYIIKSEESGFLHVLYGSDELFIQIKSSIKDETIRLTSRDFRHMSEKKDKFRLLVRLNAEPIEFSDFLTVKDIFQKQDNIKIAIENIKNYEDSALNKFIDSLSYLGGVNFILPFSNNQKLPNGIENLYENSSFNSDDEI